MPREFSKDNSASLPKLKNLPSTPNEVKKSLQYLLEIRKYSRVSKETTIKHLVSTQGFRVSLRSVYKLSNRPEIRLLANKMIKEHEKKVPQVWLYYYPNVSRVDNNLHSQFFQHLFPRTPDTEPIVNVSKPDRTEMLCVAVHDIIFDPGTNTYVTTSKVVSAISFRLLADCQSGSGIYVFYLDTLGDILFYDVVPTNGSMNDLHCPIQGFGLAEFLMSICQLLGHSLRQSPDMYLVTSVSGSVHEYYESRGFERIDDWDKVSQEIKECASLETSDITLQILLVKKSLFVPSTLNTSNLIQRLSRSREMTLNQVPTNLRNRAIDRVWHDALSEYVSKPLEPDEYNNREARNYFLNIIILHSHILVIIVVGKIFMTSGQERRKFNITM